MASITNEFGSEELDPYLSFTERRLREIAFRERFKRFEINIDPEYRIQNKEEPDGE